MKLAITDNACVCGVDSPCEEQPVPCPFRLGEATDSTGGTHEYDMLAATMNSSSDVDGELVRHSRRSPNFQKTAVV